MTAGSVVSGGRRSVLLLGTVVGISNDQKFLQCEADNWDTHAAQINSNIMMNDGMAVACNLSIEIKTNEPQQKKKELQFAAPGHQTL